MAARVYLDKPHAYFTNIDYITGKVILQIHSETSIQAIHVKLEGESRTRLSGPRQDRPDKTKTEVEVHKILYKVSSVFPSPDIAKHSSPNASFTLAAGIYEYPFKFKLPFNNACSNHNSMLTNLSMAGLRVEVARNSYQHVKKTLPPSLNTFPGEAEIKYYVKATVVRPQFYKENIRALTDFNFVPIEPPRTGNPNEETYARRQQEFARPMAPGQEKGGLFRKKSTPPMPIRGEKPPRVSVEARLPNPPILACNEPVPLRLIVTKQSPSSEIVFLQLLQIELISYTQIRAHEFARTVPLSTLILSRSNMNAPLGRGSDPIGTEWKIDANLWNRLPLPPNVAPTFQTCNLSRHYELEVRVGLAHGRTGAIMPQVIVLPLRLAVKVYSGIAPPPALLAAMASESKAKPRRPGVSQRPSIHTDNEQPPPMPERPLRPTNTVPEPQELETPIDAPPSYEDAMADAIAPIDRPEGEYQPPPASTERSLSGPSNDVKGPLDEERSEKGVYTHSSISRDSNDSIDMLPQTPRSRPESFAESLIEEPSTNATSIDQHVPKTEQPAELTINGGQQFSADSPSQPGPSMPAARSFSSRVPNRRPVPGASGGSDATQP